MRRLYFNRWPLANLCVPVLVGLMLNVLLLQTVSAQSTCYLQMSGKSPEPRIDIPHQIRSFADTLSRHQFLTEQLGRWHAAGYLLASYEYDRTSADTLKVDLATGAVIVWVNILTAPADMPLLEAAGFKPGEWHGRRFYYNEVATLLQQLVRELGRRGYPFAAVQLDSVSVSDTAISAALQIHRNTFIRFDSVIVVGNLDISSNFLEQYTGIFPDAPYDQSLVDALPGRVRQLLFANIVKQPVVEFNGNRARIILYAESRKNSRFDFILGVLPDNAITGRLVITGDMQLQLQNVFGQGENMQLQYTKLESTTKSIDASAQYPYLPRLPIGPQAGFYLYLKDSTFLERKAQFGLVYQFSGNNMLRGLVSWHSSAVLRPDTAFALANFALPDMLDVQEQSYGLGWSVQRLDYVFNPRRGFAWDVSAYAGTRTILENASIASLVSPVMPEYNFMSLYDSIDVRTVAGRYLYDVQWYIPVLRFSTILLQTRGAALLQPEPLANELIRIGGNKQLRGFDEQSLPVSEYQMATLEWRYLLGERSYAGLFTDVARLRNSALEKVQTNIALGFGASMRFETKAGIFGLVYALGGSQQDPVSIRNTKVHFGYVNFF